MMTPSVYQPVYQLLGYDLSIIHLGVGTPTCDVTRGESHGKYGPASNG